MFPKWVFSHDVAPSQELLGSFFPGTGSQNCFSPLRVPEVLQFFFSVFPGSQVLKIVVCSACPGSQVLEIVASSIFSGPRIPKPKIEI